MKRRQSTAQERLLRAISAAAARTSVEFGLDVDRGGFLKDYYALAAEEDLSCSPSALAAAALSHLQWAASRRRGTPKVRAFNPDEREHGWTSPRTIVQTVMDDMPFLVDSLTMRLNSSGHGVLTTIHPILRVVRDSKGRLQDVGRELDLDSARPESFIHFEIPRLLGSKALAQLEAEIASTLQDVKVAVTDWPRMIKQLRKAAAELRAAKITPEELKLESCRFLEWLAEDHFTLLGYREYKLTKSKSINRLTSIEGTGLGLLRDSRSSRAAPSFKAHSRRVIRSKLPLVVTKARVRSTVHRPAPLDDVGIKIFDKAGRQVGERRLLGLFTSVAYNESSVDIPLLRHKVRAIMDQSGLETRSHRGKALRHILDTLPRDELIQGSVAELVEISLGILNLEEKHKIRLFYRLDAHENFYSCLVYLPRDKYSLASRKRIEALLESGFGGSAADSQLTISESSLARLAVKISIDSTRSANPDPKRLQIELEEAITTWIDRVRRELLRQLPEREALALYERFASRFPAAYQEATDAARACRDILKLASLADSPDDLRMALVFNGPRFRFTTFHRGRSIELYRAHPVLENMGVKVVSENNYQIDLADESIWIQDFDLETARQSELDSAQIESRFQECFERVFKQDVENDAFNALIVGAGLDWREAALLRAYCKHMLQTALGFSQAYMQEVLSNYPDACRALVALFSAQFDPDLIPRERKARYARSQETLDTALDRVVSLDDDRILRAYSSAVHATLRTNFYRNSDGTPKPYYSFKFDSRKLGHLPRPRPKYEVFVYSPRMEGVHLRCGKIARGGLRWSDRREDFRTEVLGLMKAQQVKNTVIVPAGAKGGFVCKALPAHDIAAQQAEVIECYKTFVRGLLDITDNIVAGEMVRPERVLARDDADPYLVVAADKGTATFSDIANELSSEYGFWLGDAFASGGSAGYDHKKMAITARGAWEAVKRHFRELGVDIQTEDFTAVGIGDMGGDVFGNGMLLSSHMKLIAAFNHKHVFIDPKPDPEASLEERRRLFDLPRSSWDDYDRSILSEGGGIYSRASKSIRLHPAALAALGIEQASLTPPELIRAILKAPADLLFNGGIGTYVKASGESHAEASDPVNDSVRIDAKELRCRVVGEGGNLGLTQRGRIEYALAGGRLNTDFIDNSGGVDTSDREVNIKILLNDAIRRHKLTSAKRNALLAEMKDQVAALVLANNYGQTQALSMMVSRAGERVGEHARLVRILEGQGVLDRALEFLPSEDVIEQRRKDGIGFTRPELAVILSYAKIQLSTSLRGTGIPDDPYCAAELETYFPKQLSRRFKTLIHGHRLHREIVAMLISSSIINRMGPFFMLRAQEDTGASVDQVARAYAIVRELFAARRLWRDIEALDGLVQAEVQYDGVFEVSRMVRRGVYWFLQRPRADLVISTTIDRMRPYMDRLTAALPAVLCGLPKRRFEHDTRQLQSLGLSDPLAQRIASLAVLPQVLDIVEMAAQRGLDVEDVGRLYYELGRGLRLDWIREQIETLEVRGRWRAMARATLRENLGQEQRALVGSVLDRAHDGSLNRALTGWLTDSNAKIVRTKQAFEDMQAAEEMDFATLSIALKEISRLI